ncbi:hypothetical protein NQ318_015938 [Aromia moschata]|uniref:PiggyBac transposable element-derived protein domain-containing protein n=1 Tax=Aromia moschata TaxID=1265417 RepID=A0AAV8XJ32_9CUCU|nr:hypothetical protein NQ318_015938 [Aromia moschata]
MTPGYKKSSNKISTKSKRQVGWDDTNKKEIVSFLILLTTGLVPLPKIAAYWSKDDMFNNRFTKVWCLREGRLIFKQYIPNKSHKYDVKIYKLCTMQGYTHNLIVYAGKNDDHNRGVNSHFQSIVLSLVESIDDKEGRVLYADNFYSSIPLVNKMHKAHILYCGTLRINRKGIPKKNYQKNEKI